MPFPAIKLFSIFIKQLSKPMASYIKRKAKESYWLRTYICIPPAQLYHRMDVRLRMQVSGHKRDSNFKVQPLSEAMAIETGSELLGEIFIFSVGAAAVALEYWRQTANAAKKEKKQDDSLIVLRKEVNELTGVLASQRQQIDSLFEVLQNSKNFKLVKADEIKKLE